MNSLYAQAQVNPGAVNDYVQNPIRNPYVSTLTNLDTLPYPYTKGDIVEVSKLTQQQEDDNKRWPLQKFLDTGKSMIPYYTRTTKSANDFSGESFGRFESGKGFFNPGQTSMNSAGELWAPLDVQQPRRIIQSESQRGGLHTQQMIKESWNTPHCRDFNWNSKYSSGDPRFNQVYKYDSDYCREIGISSQHQGSMPYPPRE